MTVIEIVLRAILKMIVIWGSLAIVGLPIAKISIEVAYEIWRRKTFEGDI